MRSPVAASLSVPYLGAKESRAEPAPSSVSVGTSKPSAASSAEQGVRVKQEVDERIPPPTSRIDPQPLGRSQSDRSLADEPPLGTRGPGHSPSKSGYDSNKDDQRLSRDNSWTYRNGTDDKGRYDTDRNGRSNGDSRVNGRPEIRGPGIPPRYHDRERSRERDRDRDWELDRDRRPDFARLRDDRRNDDRFRGPDSRRPLDSRPYEPRVADTYRPLERRPDDGGPPRSLDDRLHLHPDSRPVFRNLGEERAIVRGPADPPNPNHPLPDAHRQPAIAAQLVDDRRAPLPTPIDRPPKDIGDRPPRDLEDRRLPPSVDRPPRGPEDRRPSPPANERLLRSPPDRRPPPGSYQDRLARPTDDRRPPPPTGPERPVRPQDEPRGPPPNHAERPPPRPVDDRRPYPPPPTFERNKANDDRRVPPPLEDRNARTGAPPLRPPPDERSLRPQPSKDDVGARPPVSLEERISRPAPSLQERISAVPARPDDRRSREPPARLDERVARPPPSLEERLSRPAVVDDRTARPPIAEDRATRPMPPPPATDRTVRPAPSDERSSLLAEPVRPPLSGPSDRTPRPDDRGRPTDRFRSRSPDRGPAPRPSVYPPRAQSLARSPPRKFEPRSRTRSPARSDILRPANDPPPRDRDMRPPYRPEPGRFGGDRRPDVMDVDPPAPRFGASYRRPSPPPPSSDGPEPYSRPRAWPPSSDPYPEDTARRPPPDARPYGREWRDGDRSYPDDWDPRTGRDWERPAPREYERDRFDASHAPGWETREERERRVSSTYPPPADATPAPRPFETRPLSSRLSDAYPPEDRSYSREIERPRYPPPEPDPPFSRVRPRSPSPLRRPGAVDDLRPPAKRTRDESYGSGYYAPSAADPPPRAGPPADYPPRARSPPAVGGTAYYDDPRAPPYRSGPPPPLPRDRDYADPRDRAPDAGGYSSFDRREPPPRIHRSPAPYNRFGRDERRYSVPPR